MEKNDRMLQVRIFGDPILRKTAKRIDQFDEKLIVFIDEMMETMKVADGVGLAANQVGKEMQLVVIDVTGGEEAPIVLINPVITEKSENMEECDEGCLSLPDISLPVKRHATVSVTAQDRHGNEFSIEKAEGFLARALQHEIDHLKGILFIDHVSSLQRTMISGKLKRLAKTGRVDV
jgi:peptide deformylase